MSRKIAAEFSKDAGGTIIILFALTLFVIAGAMGIAIDFSRAFHVKTQLANAADAAALAAAKHAAQLMKNGASAIDAKREGKDVGLSVWHANITSMDATVAPPTILLNNNDSVWTANVDYSGQVDTTIAAIAGFDQVDVSGDVEVMTGGASPAYMDFYLLLDTSQSMGVASTTAGMNQLKSLTRYVGFNPPDGCQFGCHVTGDSQNYDIAKSNGITMRIDVLRDATTQLITTAENRAATPDQYRIGLWTFDNRQNELVTPTDDYGVLQTEAAKIDLPTHHDGTQVDDALSYLNGKVADNGDGSSPDNPIKFVFLVTDGVQDGLYTGWMPPNDLPQSNHPYPPFQFPGENSPISPDACDDLKAKGLTVAVLYTKYVPFQDSLNTYNDFVKQFDDHIKPNLQACATEGFFFEATKDADIDPLLQQMYTTAIAGASKLRVTR